MAKVNKPEKLRKEGKEKKLSKSNKFWKLQSEKKNEKENIKNKDDEFEVVQQEQSESLELDDDAESESEIEEEYAQELSKQIKSMNRKGKSGGFQSMGLSFPVFKGIQHMGYKIPTPIQRKAIPALLEGGDVVAMARTGSGKTASFIIPMLEKLKTHSVKVGIRGLILSPSRELATQTAKFAKDLSKHTDLRTCVFVGGENMDTQFSALASNPDIIIATPGRLMHLILEVKLELRMVEFLVFDEADRLFEMGFAEQIREIVLKVPTARQTVLFSATLPKILIDFARAGLQNPLLIRLDVDTKISRDLQMYFFNTKTEYKEAALLYLLSKVIPQDQQCVIFAATKHHVEYINQLLLSNGFDSTYIYGTLDPMARKIHLARFKYNKVRIMVVTDVAARGIDIPLLDNVINYNFPASSKVFVHRVGRTARAGKKGSAWSLVANDEIPYMLDLQLFTGRPLIYSSQASSPDYTTQLIFGDLPLDNISLQSESVEGMVKGNVLLETLRESSRQGFKMYLKSRPTAAKQSYTRAKQVIDHSIGLHPLFIGQQSEEERRRIDLVNAISGFRPTESVFEIGRKGKNNTESLLMQKRRSKLGLTISKNKVSKQEKVENELENQQKAINQTGNTGVEIDFSGFNDISKGTYYLTPGAKIDRSAAKEKDKEFYLNYRPADDHTEAGYAVHDASFNAHANKASMELVPDDDLMFKKKPVQTWDSKKHRFTTNQVGADNKKRIRTENGTLVPASFQSDRFAQWQKKTKVEMPRIGEKELDNAQGMNISTRFRHNSIAAPTLNSKNFKRKLDAEESKWRKQGLKGADMTRAKQEFIKSKGIADNKEIASELKTAHQIAKEREEKEKRRAKTGRHAKVRGGPKGGSSRGGLTSRGSSRGGSRKVGKR